MFLGNFTHVGREGVTIGANIAGDAFVSSLYYTKGSINLQMAAAAADVASTYATQAAPWLVTP